MHIYKKKKKTASTTKSLQISAGLTASIHPKKTLLLKTPQRLTDVHTSPSTSNLSSSESLSTQIGLLFYTSYLTGSNLLSYKHI